MDILFYMRWKRKKWMALVLVLAAGAGAWPAVRWWRDYPVHHFHVVQDGALYRSGQPDAGQLRFLIDKYGLRTVVNLRGYCPDQPWWLEEEAACRKYGLRLVDIDMSDANRAEQNVRDFLAIAADPGNRPVLVHCEAGSARTGFATAAYRIALEGWPFEKAMAEARSFHFRTKTTSRTNQEYQRVLGELARSVSRPGSAPASRSGSGN